MTTLREYYNPSLFRAFPSTIPRVMVLFLYFAYSCQKASHQICVPGEMEQRIEDKGQVFPLNLKDPFQKPHPTTFNKEAKIIQWKRARAFSTNGADLRRMQIDPYLSPCTKFKSKWIKDLNVKPDTLNLIEQKVGSSLELIGTGDNSLNITPIVQALI